ncbi:MAG TPA: energy transducer TonB [Terracidiphilus sp.]|nr:energy transducer TonB [Terracidiphilus sp.]
MTLPDAVCPDPDFELPVNAAFFASATLESRTHTNPWAIGTSTAVNGALIALLLILGLRTTSAPFTSLPNSSHSISLTDFPLFALVTPQANNGGSGSGSHDLIDPTRGNPPRFTATPLAPPIVPTIVDPKLAVEPAMVKQTVTLPTDPSLPNIGMRNSTTVTMQSNGPGDGAGIGSGKNGPYGNGTGTTFGPGSGDGLLPGNDVKAPILIYAPTPEFSDEARRNKYQGICMITVVVDAQGIPRNPVVIQPLGEGLDEKALEAIPHYRFKPGMKDGHPVATRITIEVNFRLF